ncbi:MAG: hypothetical protein HY609_00490, partial [Deltaproteobacteria bacterium]|nr:hypothetical protein [Deltaproteobacteria bacterium]
MTLPWKNLFKIISTSFILAILGSPFAFKVYLNHFPTPQVHAQSTNICQKLGVNLAITASNPALQAAIQQANGVNSQFTEILVTGVGDNDLANVLSAIGNNNQQTIIRLGAGRQSENISAAEWADFLNRVNSQAGKPIIATAGHNEPYCAERRPLDQEVTFVDTVARDTNGEVTLVTGQFDIYCPPNKDGPTQEQYFKAISNIPGIDAVAMPFYTEVGGQNIDAAVALFQNYANQTIKPIYITEIGADPNNNGTGDPALLREALNRIFAADKDGQILAALVFNGLCQNPSFAYTQKYCSPECLPLVSGCAGGQTVSEAELASLATQCQAAQILPYDATIAPDNEWRLPEDLIEIATYPVSCASNIESFVAAGDDEILCTATGCKALGLKENVTYNFGDDIPWLTRPREIASTLQSNLEKIKASASTFFSAKRSLPGENPDAVAPLNKGTRERSQFNLIYEYLYTLDLWCQIYVQVTGSPYEACPLPRVFAESYPDNPLYAGFPFANELHFFTQRVKPLKYENLGSLTAQEQNVFWNTPPQMQDGVFFKPAYLVSYIPDPNIDFFDFTPDPNQPPNFTLNSRLKVIRFKIPSSIGEQGNLRRLQQEYGQELSVPVNYEPPYKNSTLSNTAYLLMPSRFAEKQAGLNQEDRRHDIDLVQNGSLEGPVINFPVDAATNPLVAQLIKVINKEGHVCTGPTGGEEADQITYPATFGFQDAWQFFNPAYIVSLFGQAARFTQNIIADISPLVPDKKSAPHYTS